MRYDTSFPKDLIQVVCLKKATALLRECDIIRRWLSSMTYENKPRRINNHKAAIVLKENRVKLTKFTKVRWPDYCFLAFRLLLLRPSFGYPLLVFLPNEYGRHCVVLSASVHIDGAFFLPIFFLFLVQPSFSILQPSGPLRINSLIYSPFLRQHRFLLKSMSRGHALLP